MTIDFTTIVTFSNGVCVLNATPNEINFLDGESVVTVSPSGARLNPNISSWVVHCLGAAMCRMVHFESNSYGLDEIEEIDREAHGVLVIGSIESAQGYPGMVFSPLPASESLSAPNTEQLMSISEFRTF